MTSFLTAVAFLTRFPVGRHAGANLGGAIALFPAVGLVLGVLLAVGAALVGRVLPGAVAALLLVAALAWMTGGLHLDGLADLADGLAGGRGDRERTLAIMRDSRIGAFGAMALVVVLVGKTLALGEVLSARPAAVLAWPVVGRFALVPLLLLFPYARPEGLGRAFRDAARPWHLAVAAACAAGAAVYAGVLLPATVGLAAALLLALRARRALGGLTGDVYGAAVEVAELAFLLAAAARVS